VAASDVSLVFLAANKQSTNGTTSPPMLLHQETTWTTLASSYCHHIPSLPTWACESKVKNLEIKVNNRGIKDFPTELSLAYHRCRVPLKQLTHTFHLPTFDFLHVRRLLLTRESTEHATSGFTNRLQYAR